MNRICLSAVVIALTTGCGGSSPGFAEDASAAQDSGADSGAVAPSGSVGQSPPGYSYDAGVPAYGYVDSGAPGPVADAGADFPVLADSGRGVPGLGDKDLDAGGAPTGPSGGNGMQGNPMAPAGQCLQTGAVCKAGTECCSGVCALELTGASCE